MSHQKKLNRGTNLGLGVVTWTPPLAAVHRQGCRGHGAGPRDHVAVPGGSVLTELGGGREALLSQPSPRPPHVSPFCSTQRYWSVSPHLLNPALFGLWSSVNSSSQSLDLLEGSILGGWSGNKCHHPTVPKASVDLSWYQVPWFSLSTAVPGGLWAELWPPCHQC